MTEETYHIFKKEARHLNWCESLEWTVDKTIDELADLQANKHHNKYNIQNHKQNVYIKTWIDSRHASDKWPIS